MRWFAGFTAAAAILTLASPGGAQGTKKQPGKVTPTKATYMVSGMHCLACVQTVSGSLKLTKGVKSAAVNPQGFATIIFDENVVSAQEVANAIAGTAHMMGKGMKYGGTLVLKVPGVNTGPTAKKAIMALQKVEGVANVALYPRQQAVGILFTGKGKTTTKQLLDALSEAGLKGAQYSVMRGSGGRIMGGGSGPMRAHAGMAMGSGGVPEPMSPYRAAPGLYPARGSLTSGGCGCSRCAASPGA